MASTSGEFSTCSVLLITLIFFVLVPPSQCQGQARAAPMISVCGPLLIPLAVCAPFVQGTAQAPGQSCCDSLNRLYGQQPECLCLVLGDNIISNVFPINRTLAVKLPSLCSLQLNASTCSSPNSTSAAATAAASPSPTTNEMPRVHHAAVGMGILKSDCMKATRCRTHAMIIGLVMTTISVLFTHFNN